jgi:(S)-2-hydroxy-acid oxidase
MCLYFEHVKRWKIVQQALRDVSIRDLSTNVLGKKVGLPIGVSPSAMQKMAHEDGEIGIARGSGSLNFE